MNFVYVAVDGDDVGSHLEYLLLTNDTRGLTVFSDEYRAALDLFLSGVVSVFGASIIFRGGDNCLLVISKEHFSMEGIEEARVRFGHSGISTLSIGVGHSPREAYLALKLAKATGKNRMCHIEDLKDG